MVYKGVQEFSFLLNFYLRNIKNVNSDLRSFWWRISSRFVSNILMFSALWNQQGHRNATALVPTISYEYKIFSTRLIKDSWQFKHALVLFFERELVCMWILQALNNLLIFCWKSYGPSTTLRLLCLGGKSQICIARGCIMNRRQVLIQ